MLVALYRFCKPYENNGTKERWNGRKMLWQCNEVEHRSTLSMSYHRGMLQTNLHNLQIWHRAIEFAEEIHLITKQFPREELYSLTKQIREAAVSVPSNIAEGSQRTTNKDFAHFILIAKGSLAEVQTQLFLSKRFGYLPEKKWGEIQLKIDALHRMLLSFHSVLLTRDL